MVRQDNPNTNFVEEHSAHIGIYISSWVGGVRHIAAALEEASIPGFYTLQCSSGVISPPDQSAIDSCLMFDAALIIT